MDAHSCEKRSPKPGGMIRNSRPSRKEKRGPGAAARVKARSSRQFPIVPSPRPPRTGLSRPPGWAPRARIGSLPPPRQRGARPPTSSPGWVLGPILNDPAEPRDALPQEALHSLLECHLCAGSPVTGALEAHAGILPFDRHQFDIPSIRLKERPDLGHGRRDLLGELTCGIVLFCAHRFPSVLGPASLPDAPPRPHFRGRRHVVEPRTPGAPSPPGCPAAARDLPRLVRAACVARGPARSPSGGP
jgi:hypothetical protein